MKQITLLILLLTSIQLLSQVEVEYPHCNCTDQIDQFEPIVSGKYKRVCDKKVIETGAFENDLKVGKWETFSLKGNKIREFNYTSGKLDGVAKAFYADGKPKFSGHFKNNKREGNWTYYNPKGKLIQSLTFIDGKLTELHEVLNLKGKKKEVAYDYTKGKYTSNNPKYRYYQNEQILQNDNKGEWFILYHADDTKYYESKAHLSYALMNDIFTSNLEIPIELWDTYVNGNYKAVYNFTEDGQSNIDIVKLDTHAEGIPQFTFIAITNEISKLKSVEPSEFSMFLLEHKILEALYLSGPFEVEGSDLEIYVPFVLNKIKGRKN